MQSMRRTLEEMERCAGELRLPQGAEPSLLVFPRARALHQQLEELEQLARHQATLPEVPQERQHSPVIRLVEAVGMLFSS